MEMRAEMVAMTNSRNKGYTRDCTPEEIEDLDITHTGIEIFQENSTAVIQRWTSTIHAVVWCR